MHYFLYFFRCTLASVARTPDRASHFPSILLAPGVSLRTKSMFPPAYPERHKDCKAEILKFNKPMARHPKSQADALLLSQQPLVPRLQHRDLAVENQQRLYRVRPRHDLGSKPTSSYQVPRCPPPSLFLSSSLPLFLSSSLPLFLSSSLPLFLSSSLPLFLSSSLSLSGFFHVADPR